MASVANSTHFVSYESNSSVDEFLSRPEPWILSGAVAIQLP